MGSNIKGVEGKLMSKVFIRACEDCGELIEYTYENKATRLCPKCRHNRQLMCQSKKRAVEQEKKLIAKRADRIAHQQDRTVWTHDYAERQKARTLAMIGGIKV